MAIAHFQVNTISRGKGASVIAKAAYNSGSKLNTADGQLFAYTAKGGIRHRALILSRPSTDASISRQAFWQAVDASEKRKDACLAREFVGSLPCELSYEQNLELAQNFAQAIIARYGVQGADLAIHYPTRWRPTATHHENPHLHLLIPDRNTQGKKLGMNHNRNEIFALRELWEKSVNTALAAARHDARISMKTNEAQISTLDADIAALKRQEAQLAAELTTITQQMEATHEHSITRRPSKDETRHRSQGQTTGSPQRGTNDQSDIQQTPQGHARNPESGHNGSASDDKRRPRPTGSPARPGTITNAGANTGSTRRLGSQSRQLGTRPTRRRPLTALAAKIASRLDGLRYERQAQITRHPLTALATRIASRIDGERYERQQRYRHQQTAGPRLS